MRRRVWLFVGVAALYSVAAWSVHPGFYDSFQPLPYNWVNPPAKFAKGNRPPASGHFNVRVGPNGQSDPATIATDDAQPQCILSTLPGGFQPPASRAPIPVDIKPVASFPAPPPGIKFLTNVYLVTASSPITQKAVITLTFSDGQPAPTSIYNIEQNGSSWGDIGSTGASAPFSISAETRTLGYFAAGYDSSRGVPQGARLGGGQLLPILTAIAIIVVVLAGVPLALLRRRRVADDEELEEE